MRVNVRLTVSSAATRHAHNSCLMISVGEMPSEALAHRLAVASIRAIRACEDSIFHARSVSVCSHLLICFSEIVLPYRRLGAFFFEMQWRMTTNLQGEGRLLKGIMARVYCPSKF